jgi:hypothetical protein
MERQFQCFVCGTKFDSAESRPYCPQLCRLPIEEETKYNDFITTKPLPQAVIAQPEEEKAPKRKPGRPPKENVDRDLTKPSQSETVL